MNNILRVTICLIGSIAALPCAAEDLGRLFFTPEQRALLDINRAQSTRPANDDALILNGIVQIHGGKRTVWINGVPQQAGGSDTQAPASMSVTIPGQTKPVRVKVGQRVLLERAGSTDKPAPQSPETDAAIANAPEDN